TRAAKDQVKHQSISEPTTHFLSVLRAALSSGRAHLAGADGSQPGTAPPEACGWRKREDGSGGTVLAPLGDRGGLGGDGHVYLEHEATYRVVQVAARDTGEPLPVTLQTLKKRLFEKSLLASRDEARETLTTRKTLSGSRQDVLDFLQDVILPQEQKSKAA